MTFEARDNSGSLFKNQRKEKDSHPDYTGNGTIDGKQYWFSAWIKTDRNGNKFMSMAFKPKEDEKPAPKRRDPISTGRPILDDLDDSIPFAPEFR